MARVDIERQKELEPKRVQYAKEQIEKLGYEVEVMGPTQLKFEHNGYTVMFWPYSGWHTGKSIKDGRGLKKLLNQISQCH